MVDVAENVIALFDELVARGEKIKEACRKIYFSGGKKTLDEQGFAAWRTSSLTLIRSTFGSSSPHHDSFVNVKLFDHYNATLLYLGILTSARDDVRKGYFYHKDLMLSVNVFNAFLTRAGDMAARGETRKAAGILEAVLSEAVRKLADLHGMPLPPRTALAQAADALVKAGAVSADTGAGLRQVAGVVADPDGRGREVPDYGRCLAWTQAFVHDNIGTRIVIAN